MTEHSGAVHGTLRQCSVIMYGTHTLLYYLHRLLVDHRCRLDALHAVRVSQSAQRLVVLRAARGHRRHLYVCHVITTSAPPHPPPSVRSVHVGMPPESSQYMSVCLRRGATLPERLASQTARRRDVK
eukprot:4169082-Pyramimonas_sp.AAC.1